MRIKDIPAESRPRERLKQNGAEALSNSEDIAKYYMERLGDKKKEHFIAVFLDSKNRIIKDEPIYTSLKNFTAKSQKSIITSFSSSNSFLFPR